MKEENILTKENVLNYIKEYDYVSHTEFVKYFNCEGTYHFILKENNNIIIFYGLDEKSSLIIDELMQEKKVKLYPCNFLTYLADGGYLNLPIIKSKYQLKNTKKTSWIPHVLRLFVEVKQ